MNCHAEGEAGDVIVAGIVEMTEPETRLLLEAPGGLIEVTAKCRNGKGERVATFEERIAAETTVRDLPAAERHVLSDADLTTK